MKTSLCVQIIHTYWTKKSRGGELATPRNAVPLAFPPEDLQSGYLTVQTMSYGERDAFQTPLINRKKLELDSNLHFKWGSFAIHWDGQLATTEFHHSGWEAPVIKSPNPQIGHFIVGSGEWVRLRWQSRFSDAWDGQSNWWYEHTCINVARFDGNENPNVFLQSEPIRQFVHLPHLR